MWRTLRTLPRRWTQPLWTISRGCRHASNTTQFTSSSDLVRFLSQCSTPIPVQASNVQFIPEPAGFYDALMDGIGKARERLVLAALYIGTGRLERALLDGIQASLSAHRNLRCHMLFDCIRSQRGGSSSTVSLLTPLVAQYPDRVRVSLYHTPALRGLLKRLSPPRYNETLGVTHLKAFVFDDTLLMTGANLSDIYFTNRQDRYVLFHRSPALCHYASQLVQAVSASSFTLSPAGALVPPALDPLRAPRAAFGAALAARVTQTLHLPPSATDADARGSASAAGSPRLRRARSEPHGPAAAAAAAAASGADAAVEAAAWGAGDTLVFPTVQLGPFGLRQDSAITTALFRHAPARGRTTLASAYFNLTAEYADALLSSAGRIRIVSAAAEANGFYRAEGMSRFIPDAYDLLQCQFAARVRARQVSARIELRDWYRSGWTFHGKGLWMAFDESERALPAMTAIGSPNFGQRSVARDLESQLLVVTRNPDLQAAMRDELGRLLAYSRPLDDTQLQQRTFHPFVRMATPLVRNLL